MKKYVQWLALFLIVGCSETDVAFEKNTKRGLALIEDETLGTVQKPAGNVDIFLTNQSTDTSSFIIRIKSDADGGFLFTHLPAGNKSNYYLYSFYILNGTIYQSGFKKLKDFVDSPDGSIVIKPQHKPGIKISLLDSISGGAVPGASICLFNNSQLAAGGTCDGSIRSSTSNENGIAYFENLSNGKYVATVKQKIGNTTFSGNGIVNFSGTTINSIIKLQQAGIVLYVKDATYNTPVSGINVCLFTNRILGEGSSCTASIQTVTSDSYGKVLFENLSSGTHYFVVNQKINTVTFAGNDKVDFKVGTHVEKTMVVNPM